MRYLIVAVMATGLTTPAHSHPSANNIVWSGENLHADTSCGIIWGPTIQLSPEPSTGFEAGPSLVIQGDTVHVTWLTSDYKFPYRRSVDNGESFEPLRELVDGTLPVYRARFLSTSSLLAGFYKTDAETLKVIRSTNGGESWFLHGADVTSTAYVGNESLVGTGDTLFLIDHAGPGWRVLRSFDAGQSWNPVGRLLPGSRNTLAITDSILHEVHRFRYDSAGQVYDLVVQYIRSTDWGETWSDSVALSTVATQVAGECHVASDISQTGPTLFAVWKDAKYGCAVLGGCAILGRISNTSGSSFHPEHRFDQHPAGVLPFAAANGNVLVVAWTDISSALNQLITLSMSTNGGETWCMPMVVDTGSTPKVTIRGSDIHIVWHRSIAGGSGTMRTFYKKGKLIPSTVKDHGNQRMLESRLLQNYPNPFNPTTKIPYTIHATGHVTLTVYDILGREVAKLVDEVKERGEYVFEWNAATLPSGVYFCRMSVPSTHIAVKPMMLIR